MLLDTIYTLLAILVGLPIIYAGARLVSAAYFKSRREYDRYRTSHPKQQKVNSDG